MRLKYHLLLPLLLLASTSLWANEAFPVRALYPKVETIELEELYAKRSEVLIFDVRSSYEYDTLHIKGAGHLALDDRDFVAKLAQLRKEETRPLVFYCNGHTCKKSYKATQKAMHGHIDNVYAFDAGIFDWTNAHPEEAVLLGKSPVDPKRLISKEMLERHMLEPEAFGERVGSDTIVLDIRETMQKSALNLFPMQQRSVALDNKQLKTFVDKAKRENKTLLIYDAVGKQVRWLQYYLEEENVDKYYFMRGGAKAFLNY
jgi:rhodanese-related sulfurtransferase